MATYSQGCYSIGGYGYAGNFTLYVELSEKWIDTNANTSYVDYNVYCQSSGSGSINANHFKYFAIDGNEVLSTTERVSASSPNAYIHLCDGTIGPLYHDGNGNRSVGFYAEIEASSYGVGASIEGTFNLATIPRYAYFSKHQLEGTGLNNIDIRYRPDRWITGVQYSLNGGSWTNVSTISGQWNSPDNDIVYRISNLSPNTNYSVRTRIQYANNLWTTSGTISATTKDIARVTSAPNINLGDNATINITNPSNSNIKYYVEITNPTQNVLERTANNGSNTIVFTDSELDMIYKKMGASNSTTLRFGVNTDNRYWHWLDKTCTLTGNQKTANIKINGSWKRAKKWVKINGSWKRCVRWIKVNGSWKRCI